MNKKSKKIFLSLSFLALLSVPAFSETGVDSGGGSTLVTPQGVSMGQLLTSISQSKRTLVGWLKRQNVEYTLRRRLHPPGTTQPAFPAAPTAIDDAIHSGPKEIISRLGLLLGRDSIEYKKDAYCQGDGAHKDASFNASRAQPICISLMSLQAKLNADNVNSETFALLAHELAHAAGLNETQAEVFQIAAKEAYAGSMNPNTARELGDATMNTRGAIQNEDWGSGNTPEALCEALENLPYPRGTSALMDNVPLFYSSKFPTSVFNGEQITQFIEADIRAANVSLYACANNSRLPQEERARAQAHYEKVFSGANEIGAYNFFMKNLSFLEPIWPQTSKFSYLKSPGVLRPVNTSKYHLAAIVGNALSIPKITNVQQMNEEAVKVFPIIDRLGRVVVDFHDAKY